MNGPDLLEYCGMDARKWADEFIKTAIKLRYSEMDAEWVEVWFANAIMNTHDILLNVGPHNGDHAEYLSNRLQTVKPASENDG